MNENQSFPKIFAERLGLVMICTIFLFTLSLCGTLALAASKPTVTISPQVVEYKAGVEILFSGSGFEPNQELKLHINMGDTQWSVGYLMKPLPVSNNLGAFASVWKLKREISRKVFQPLPMVYTVSVLDSNDVLLCTVPLLFKK